MAARFISTVSPQASLPPKSAIREIRINQNPFSSEYDKLGYGRIEIFTKPGTDQWHGSAQLQGNDSSFNSKNPFASGTEPGYYSTLFNGNIGGPISKKASLFISGQYRDVNDVAVINAQVLDSNFQPTPFSASVAQPRTRINFGPRVDYQLSKNNTLSVRYQYFRDNQDNNGLSGFALPSQAYNVLTTEHTLQVSDTQVFGTTIVNDTHFQYIRDGENQIASSALPTVVVPSSFTGGGNNQQNVNDVANHYELQNYTQWVHGTHTVKFGVRLRQTIDTNNATSAFNGNYTFSSLIAYQTTEQGLAAGLPFSQIQAMGGGAIQLTLNNGVPQTYVSVFDSGWYIQDDWRARPNLTLSGGLRLEQQTGIANHLDWEPRVAIAWGIGSAKAVPKTVLRIGTGLFYDRFTENLILQANRLNGINQEKFVVTLALFFRSQHRSLDQRDQSDVPGVHRPADHLQHLAAPPRPRHFRNRRHARAATRQIGQHFGFLFEFARLRSIAFEQYQYSAPRHVSRESRLSAGHPGKRLPIPIRRHLSPE